MVFLRPLIRYADFKGRARRSEYWGFWLFQCAVGGLFGGLAVVSVSNPDPAVGGTGFLACIGLATLAALVFAIPQWAVTVRRLHDTDRSAWWLMLQAPGALSPLLFLGAIIGAAQHAGQGTQEAAAAILSAAAGGLLLLAAAGLCNLILLILMWLPGTDGDNRFGPDPRGPSGYGSLSAPAYGGIAEDRLDQLFAEARRDGGEPPPQKEARWKPDLDFGPMNGRPAPAPEPVTRQSATAWPEAPSGPTFGKRGL